VTGESSVDVLTIVQQPRALMVYSCTENAFRIVSRDQSFDTDRKVWAFGEVRGTDGMNIVSAIRLAGCTSQALISVSL
jgi:hypothetical protein